MHFNISLPKLNLLLFIGCTSLFLQPLVVMSTSKSSSGDVFMSSGEMNKVFLMEQEMVDNSYISWVPTCVNMCVNV